MNQGIDKQENQCWRMLTDVRWRQLELVPFPSLIYSNTLIHGFTAALTSTYMLK